MTAIKCTKKRDSRAYLVLQSTPIAFLPFSLKSPLLLPNLPLDRPVKLGRQTADECRNRSELVVESVCSRQKLMAKF